MQNSEGENKVHYLSVWKQWLQEMSSVRKIKLFDGQPSSKVSQELLGAA